MAIATRKQKRTPEAVTYSFEDETSEPTIQSFMGLSLPQSRHLVWENWVEQWGQTPWVWKVSNGWPHFPHFQYSPIGGAVLQVGQAKPSRRGSLARRKRARACCRPLQQFISMKTAIAPNQSVLAPEREADESGDSDQAKDRGDHQTAGTSHHKPEQGAKDLAAIERIDGKDVEDQQAQVDVEH